MLPKGRVCQIWDMHKYANWNALNSNVKLWGVLCKLMTVMLNDIVTWRELWPSYGSLHQLRPEIWWRCWLLSIAIHCYPLSDPYQLSKHQWPPFAGEPLFQLRFGRNIRISWATLDSSFVSLLASWPNGGWPSSHKAPMTRSAWISFKMLVVSVCADVEPSSWGCLNNINKTLNLSQLVKLHNFLEIQTTQLLFLRIKATT